MKISKKLQYGLRSMIYLARNHKKKEPISLKEISKAEGISYLFLEKIFLQFERKGLVKGIRGRFGGYLLSKSPSKINIAEITKALEGKDLIKCEGCGKSKECSAKTVWDKLQKSFFSTLENTTLLSVLK